MRSLIVVTALAAMAACGPEEVEKVLQDIEYDVGGSVVYEGDPTLPLPGTTVTLTNVLGEQFTATTDASGLWVITDLAPGHYAERYELAGYEPRITVFALEAGGENDIADPFVDRGQTGLREPSVVATVSTPLNMQLEDGDLRVDGVAGATLVYTMSTDGDIVVTFDRPMFDGGRVRLLDTDTGDTIDASANATGTIFTFTRAAMDAMDGGNGLSADSNTLTRHELQINGMDYFTPIHGELRSMDAEIWFNAVN